MEEQENRSWWGRNWKWVVPVGCLSPLVICCGGGALIFTLVFGAMKSSDPYKEAVKRAQANQELQAALGQPIEPTFFVTGSVNVDATNGTGRAALLIPISGSKTAGVLLVEAEKVGGAWQYSKMEVTVPESGKTIDLRTEGKTNDGPEAHEAHHGDDEGHSDAP
jgi:Cytochrome oxidase complex assembly protein 1